MLDAFADRFCAEANTNSVYCVPVEHISLQQLLKLAARLNISPQNLGSYFSVDLNKFDRYAKSIFNVAIIAIKDDSGKTFFHLQPKLFPALLEESKNIPGYYFQGGRTVTVFRSQSVSFAAIICFDFIGRGGLVPNALRQWLSQPGNELDLLFVLQVNPQPLHREFERTVYQFVNHPACQNTSLIFVNCDSSSQVRTKEHGRITGFNRTAVVGKFNLEQTSEYKVEQALVIAADKRLGEEVLQLNEQRRLMLVGKGERVAWLRISKLRDRLQGPTYPRTNDIRLFTYYKQSLRDLSFAVVYSHGPVKEPLPPAEFYRPLTINEPALFVGRATEIVALHDFLAGKQRCLLIHGPAGLGKSTLAQRVASRTIRENPRLYSAGLWLSSKDRQLSLKRFMQEIALALNYPYLQQLDASEQKTEILRLFRTVLRRASIVIVDNVETINDPALVRFIEEISKYAKVILTSRNKNFPARCVKLPLQPMVENDLALLAQQLNAGTPQTTLKIVKLVAGSPFVLHLLVGYLRSLPNNAQETHLAKLSESGESVVDWVFDQTLTALGKRARVAVNALQLFADTFTEHAINAVTGLPVNTVTGVIDQLRARYLVELIEYAEPLHRRYQVHPLVRTFSRARTPLTSTAVRYINYYSSFVEQHCRAETFAFIDHDIHNIQKALELCLSNHKLSTYFKTVSLLYHYQYERGFWNDAIDYCTDVYRRSKKTDNGFYSLEASLRVSWCAFRKEDLGLAKRWLKMATRELARLEKVPRRLQGLLMETKARIFLGDKKVRSEEAQEIIRTAIRGYERLKDQEAATLWARAVTYLGELQLEERRYQEATDTFNRVKEFAEAQAGRPFATKILAWTMGNLGETLLLQSLNYTDRVAHLEICANLFREGLLLARRIERQHTIAHCSWGLGLALQGLGRPEAKSYLSSARDIYERLGKRSRLSFLQ
jgi:hypothetical protein